MSGKNDVVRILINEIVLPIAFIGGVYRAVGTSPTDATIGALGELATSQYVQDWIAIVGTASVLVFLAGIAASYLVGKVLGLASFASAFVSGWIVLSMPQMGAFLLILSIILAIAAPLVHGKRSGGGPPTPTRR
jgi:hypothetical protein